MKILILFKRRIELLINITCQIYILKIERLIIKRIEIEGKTSKLRNGSSAIYVIVETKEK